jgi:alpha-beta hydrolase superfamily lysophospholipase
MATMPATTTRLQTLPRLRRWITRILLVGVTALVTVIVGAALDARRRHPPLSPWHRLVPAAEVTAADLGPASTLDEYLRREAAVFEEVHRTVELALPEVERTAANRYNLKSVSSPTRLPRDYNRTFEVAPPSPRGGVLLVHGLTDAPYSMRALAERLGEAGFYALALRMPGHGGVPGGLTRASWKDWLAAVQLGARHAAARAGAGRPFVIVGYSNGGALAVKYALEAIASGTGPRPDRLVLLSPMVGVTPFARLSTLLGRLSPIPYFDRAAWLDVLPEYNPFKFNSFPTNAARQTYDLTHALAADLAARTADGRIRELPPVLTFQSLVDATVSTEAVVRTLYAALPGNGSELVMFDVNRSAGLDAFVKAADRALIDTLFDRQKPRRYGVTVVSNASRDTLDVATWQVPAGATRAQATPLGMAWPTDIFSLSHVAIPFPQDDPVYGTSPRGSTGGSISLGALSPRGERAVLTVPIDTLMRATYNPFFPYLADRTVAWITDGPPSTAARPPATAGAVAGTP